MRGRPTCDTLVWIPQVQAFSAAHRTVIFDNRDAGQSSMADGDYEIADMAQDALALADHLELDTFHLLGVSMGGAISQEIALAAPERVRTLTLAVTWPGGGTYFRRSADVWSARVAQISLEQHVDELMLLNHSERFYEQPEMVEFIRTAMLNNPHPQPPEAFSRQVHASSRHEARDRLGSLTMPDARDRRRVRPPDSGVEGTRGRVPDPGRQAHGSSRGAPRPVG